MGGEGSAVLRLAVVGPTHPYKGGIALHTTSLAHHLQEAGHDVTLVSWSHLLPPVVYDGDARVPGGVPEVPPFPRTVRALSWARPDTWLRAGRRLQGFDALVLVHVLPLVVPPHLAVLRGARRGRLAARVRGAAPRRGPRSILVCHNVLPHESHILDRRLMSRMFTRVDAVLVHSAEQARLAHGLGAPRVSVADLPPHLPEGRAARRPAHEGPTRLLALGLVREYKGIDVLLEALKAVPGPTLTIAGEMLGRHADRVRALAAEPRLAGRVTIHDGYVPAEALPGLFASHDVLTLPYRRSTASQNVLLGHAHGLPVLASDVGVFSQQVTDDVDGLLVPPSDERALAGALRRLADRTVLERLRAGVQDPDVSGPWARYVGTVEALAAPDAAAADDEVPAPEPVRPGLAYRLGGSVRSVVARHRVPLPLRRSDLPDWVLPSDVLTDPAESEEARAAARGLGLPRCADPAAAWAALGALAAIVRLGDDGRRSAVIVDESGSRSPLSRWARAIGFAPVELGLTGAAGSPVAALDVDTGALDVISRVHPGGCDGRDVDETLGQASWALRSGGLLIITLPLGRPGAGGTLRPADVRGLLARAHDLGFVLVGDLDGDVNARMMRAGAAATATGSGGWGKDLASSGLVRLTLRRR